MAFAHYLTQISTTSSENPVNCCTENEVNEQGIDDSY